MSTLEFVGWSYTGCSLLTASMAFVVGNAPVGVMALVWVIVGLTGSLILRSLRS